MKTPEEILDEFAVFDGRTIQEFCLMAMKEYGKQQYNQAVLDCIENSEIDCGEEHGCMKSFLASDEFGNEFGIIVNGESMKKLLKQ